MSTAPSAAATWVVAASLLIVVALCWWWIVAMAGDMYGPMTGAAAWMMTTRWDWPHMALLFTMWSAMMVGMMVPSAVAAIVGYGRTLRGTPTARVAPMGVFVAAYVLVWMLFSLAATLTHRVLYALHLLSPMMEPATTTLGGGLLLAAGVYQLLPLKRTWLASCRTTAGLAGRPQDRTVAEAFRAGMRYGRACLASNWLLMLLLFAGGVMNLAVIAALTGVVLFEKIARLGTRSTWATGGLLVGLSLWMLGR
jgi:predicted metal-binding membrane protein